MNGARRCMPALLTQMSIGPTVSSIRAMPADTAAGSVTSNGAACTAAPVRSRSARATSVRARPSRALTATSAPAVGQSLGQRQADAAGGAGDDGRRGR